MKFYSIQFIASHEGRTVELHETLQASCYSDLLFKINNAHDVKSIIKVSAVS